MIPRGATLSKSCTLGMQTLPLPRCSTTGVPDTCDTLSNHAAWSLASNSDQSSIEQLVDPRLVSSAEQDVLIYRYMLSSKTTRCSQTTQWRIDLQSTTIAHSLTKWGHLNGLANRVVYKGGGESITFYAYLFTIRSTVRTLWSNSLNKTVIWRWAFRESSSVFDPICI